MALVKHAFNAANADGADATKVRSSNWNADHDVSGLIASGTEGAKPAANTVAAGGMYYATDSGILYRSDAANWTAISPQQSAGMAPTVDGGFGYDTTNKRLVAGGNQSKTGYIPRVMVSDDDVATAGNALDAGTISTTETAFGSQYIVPANFMQSKKVLRISFIIEQVSPGTATSVKFNIRWGGVAGTIIYGGSAGTPGTNRTDTVLHTAIIEATAGPGASVNAYCSVSPRQDISGWNNHVATAQPVAIATNAQNTVVLTVTYGANTAGNINKLHTWLVEELG